MQSYVDIELFIDKYQQEYDYLNNPLKKWSISKTTWIKKVIEDLQAPQQLLFLKKKL